MKATIIIGIIFGILTTLLLVCSGFVVALLPLWLWIAGVKLWQLGFIATAILLFGGWELHINIKEK